MDWIINAFIVTTYRTMQQSGTSQYISRNQHEYLFPISEKLVGGWY